MSSVSKDVQTTELFENAHKTKPFTVGNNELNAIEKLNFIFVRFYLYS